MATVMDGTAPLPRGRSLAVAPRRANAFPVFIAPLVFFMIAFPKGGVRIYDVPITLGYLLTPILIVSALARGTRSAVPKDRLLALLPAIALVLWSATVVSVNGTDSFGYTLSYFISALYLPLFGLVFFSGLTLDDCGDLLQKTLVWAIRFVVIYGIFLFLFKIATGRWIEIPYLTVNADDVGNLDSKFINRGSIFKLISTYNNGNIFGVAMCVVGPIYLRLERSKTFMLAFYGALFLTLSRTVWIGIIAVIILRALSNKIRPTTILYLSGGLVASGLAIWYILGLIGRDLDFILDGTLGNRVDQLNVFFDPRMIPDHMTTVLPEIVYTGVLGNYGYPGLALFVAHLLVVPIILWIEGTHLLSQSRASACLQGLLIYPALAASDSAYNFPPVMMIFWMVAGFGLWFRQQELRAMVAWRES